MTKEQDEANIQEILRKFPAMTRVDIEAWDKVGSPDEPAGMWEGIAKEQEQTQGTGPMVDGQDGQI